MLNLFNRLIGHGALGIVDCWWLRRRFRGVLIVPFAYSPQGGIKGGFAFERSESSPPALLTVNCGYLTGFDMTD